MTDDFSHERLSMFFGHVDEVLHTLAAVDRYLSASDIAKCQLNHYPEVAYSPLTQDVKRQVDRLKAVISDFLLERHTGEPPAPKVEEELPPLPDNPLGSKSLPGQRTIYSTPRVTSVPVMDEMVVGEFPEDAPYAYEDGDDPTYGIHD